MRTFVHALILSGLLLPVAGLAGSASAADLDQYYEPEAGPPPPVAVLPPPPPPCGVYRPCLRPRFGYGGPLPYRFYAQPAYVYEKPAYAPIEREGYGYDYDRERFERAHRHFEHYGYEHPRQDRYEPRDDHPRERAGRNYGARPYADPLGHRNVEHLRDEQFGYDRRDDDEHFDRRRDPYDRG